MTETPQEYESEHPRRDFAKMFDLGRTTRIKDIVDQIEREMRDADAARDNLKAIVAKCRKEQFSPRDIAAMKKIAKLRKDDKAGDAREQLEALERIGKAVGMDLFDWGASRS